MNLLRVCFNENSPLADSRDGCLSEQGTTGPRDDNVSLSSLTGGTVTGGEASFAVFGIILPTENRK